MKKYDIFGDNFSERGSVTTNRTFRFVGYGIDANLVFEELVTKFSIARGCFQDKKPSGRLFNLDGSEYKCSFVR